MTSIDTIILDVADASAAQTFYDDAFGIADRLGFRESDAPTSGFRGFTLSLVVSQPGNAEALLDAAVDAGARTLKPLTRSLWGCGGVVQAPDGAIWKVATSTKKDTRPVAKAFDDLVLLLGVADVAASKRFYLDHGLEVARSFGRRYVEFAHAEGAVTLALYGRRALAKDAGVAHEGSGSHRVAIAGALEAFTDPDGFAWEPARVVA